MTYLRPDSKSQVTIEYGDDNQSEARAAPIVVSTQHDEFVTARQQAGGEKAAEKAMRDKIREDVRTILIPRTKARLERAGDRLSELIGDDYILHVNPTGKFVIGGPHGDTGVTGRKIIVDTLRRPGRARRRGLLGQGQFEGRSQRGLCGAAYRQEPGRCRRRRRECSFSWPMRSASHEPLSVYVDTLRYEPPRGSCRRRDRRAAIGEAVRPAPGQDRRAVRSA